jgi:hypothetical protein
MPTPADALRIRKQHACCRLDVTLPMPGVPKSAISCARKTISTCLQEPQLRSVKARVFQGDTLGTGRLAELEERACSGKKLTAIRKGGSTA